MTTTENKPNLSKYEEALAKYNTNIDDNDVREAVKKIITEKVPENDNLDVKKFLFGSIELTTLKTTDSDVSVMAFTEKVNQFDEQYPDLPHVATICVYPCFAEIVKDTLEAAFRTAPADSAAERAAHTTSGRAARSNRHNSIPVKVSKGLFWDNLNQQPADSLLRDSVRNRYLYQRVPDIHSDVRADSLEYHTQGISQPREDIS